MGKGYGQFCPVAMAAEVLCERWVPLVLRELMYGSTRFNDIARGVPLMSRALLAQRLRELEEARVVRKEADDCYRLAPAGEALRPLVEQMGMWAQQWHRGLAEKDLDGALLMWSLHRSLHVPDALERRVVLRFDFHGLPRSARRRLRSALNEGRVKMHGERGIVRVLPQRLPLNGEAMHGIGLLR